MQRDPLVDAGRLLGAIEGASLTGSELRGFLRDKLAPFEMPRKIEFGDEFPLTITGKARKYVMRERMAVKLGRNAG